MGTRKCNFMFVLSPLLLFLYYFSHIYAEEVKQKGCNLYEGKWVYDESYPLYDSLKCPLIRKEFDCLKYGRFDDHYLKYRWQPNECELPRFDGVEFLRKQKGKTIMFVGDSISLNQWQSLACLLYTAVHGSNVTRQAHDLTTTVKFQDYGVSVVYFLSNLLVDIEVEEFGRSLKLNSFKNGGDTWKQADVLIFNTWLWWYRTGIKQGWDYIDDDGIVLEDMDRTVAFRKALINWAKWVELEVQPNKARVFFRGMSPSHYNGLEWNEPGVRNCANETRPISGSQLSDSVSLGEQIVKESISSNNISSSNFVNLLDIRSLSQLRKDGHTSTHNGFGRMDCTHWCVAGVPDTWNHLLYAQLLIIDDQQDTIQKDVSDNYL